GAPLPLRTVFIALNLLILLSVFVFHAAMSLSFLDALYFIVSTVTTVGYGDITPHHATPWLKVYACFVMLLGSLTVATLYSIITDFIVTARFQEMLGRQRTPDAGHTVLVGLGNVGYRIAEELHRAGTPVIAIERHAEGPFAEPVRGWAHVVIG